MGKALLIFILFVIGIVGLLSSMCGLVFIQYGGGFGAVSLILGALLAAACFYGIRALLRPDPPDDGTASVTPPDCPSPTTTDKDDETR